ncbi:unnamed protein product [Didymodactylos carnosus]|uniref:Uncharacterized protein n=1 Tax=Didymodactylos carnosus TaxID=1234261 RepID=A0A815JD38_9BILA|nr:unnamed protein product [Didymodactylos carnosus]CAF1377865.1 unnamed protein product [Didymodactylos carnosus]CAF3592871.1 unnamed protein product [Didymodactylos carnosus]CAF4270094.1 unnamed protein product [Didymodactylos carnosus]
MPRPPSQSTTNRHDRNPVSKDAFDKTSRSMPRANNSTDGRKRAAQVLTIVNKQQMSDISVDEADEPQLAKRQRVSSVHIHAEKLSVNEYRCQLCSKIALPGAWIELDDSKWSRTLGEIERGK